MFLRYFYPFFFFFLITVTQPLLALAADATFSWLPNSESSLAGYKIHFGTASNAYTQIIDAGVPSTVNGRVSVTVSGLANGTTYYFAATAYDSSGSESGYSTEVTHVVEGVAITPEPNGVARFSWLPNSDANLAGYKIHYGTASRNYSRVTDVGISTLINGRAQATITSLIAGTTYYFAATAYDTNGAQSAYSTEVVYTVGSIPTDPQPPTANNSTVSGNQGTPIFGTLSYTNTSGLPATFTIATQPAHGTLTLQEATGSFTYTPATQYHGADNFIFTVTTSAGTSNAATVGITVIPLNNTPVNGKPTAQSASITLNEDTTKTGQLAGSDPDGNSLTYRLTAPPTKGTVSVSASGAYTYTPNTNANGADSFAFVVNDGTIDSASATVSITIIPVNDKPTAQSASITLNEDTTKTGQLAGSDPDGNSLTYRLTTPPTKGTVSVSASGAYTYTPNTNANGADSFAFVVNDGTIDSASATVSITIIPVNDKPTAQSASITLNEDTTKTGQLAGSDPDGNSLTYRLTAPPTKGTVSVSASGAYTYTPNTNANGADSFAFVVNDGTIDSASATVSITIIPVNDKPDVQDLSFTVEGTQAYEGHLTGSDPEQSTLNFTIVTRPEKGSVILNSNGSFRYTANTDAEGSDFFTFVANDGSMASNPGRASITLQPALFQFESGELQVSSDWQHVGFDNSFTAPVVVAKTSSINNDEAGSIRIRNINQNGFEIRFQEWDSLDGSHPAEKVTYLVMEKGSHKIGQGSVKAGCLPLSGLNQFTAVSFPSAFTGQPVVISSITSVNESDAVSLRIKDITANGFKAALQEQESNDGYHAEESACYIAWEKSTGVVNGVLFEAGVTTSPVTNQTHDLKFQSGFPEIPYTLVEMQTTNGTDTSVAKQSNVTVQGLQVKIMEETSRDPETSHIEESVGYLAIAPYDPAGDPDGDLLTNEQEIFTYKTHPGLADSDSDGLTDNDELAYWQSRNINPLSDIDSDGLANIIDSDSDGDGISDGAEIEEGTDPADAASHSSSLPLELGEADIDHNPVRITFAQTFSEPVIIATMVTKNGGDPCVIRISNVDSNGFTVRLQEWDYLDGQHAKETISYMIMEKGKYTLENGTMIEAGMFETGATSASPKMLLQPMSKKPVILTSIMSTNEEEAVTGRVKNISSSGFEYFLQEQEKNPLSHARETVAYIAWEPGNGTQNGMRFAVGSTASSITHKSASLSFGQTFASRPVMLAGMQTVNEIDSSGLRITKTTTSGMTLYVQEEKSKDTETTHAKESAGYIAILAE